MSHYFPRPLERYLTVHRAHADGACAECQASELADYRVLGEGGWWDVRKCQRCLASVRRERAPLFGTYEPLGQKA